MVFVGQVFNQGTVGTACIFFMMFEVSAGIWRLEVAGWLEAKIHLNAHSFTCLQVVATDWGFSYGFIWTMATWKKLLLINSCGYSVSLEHNKWVLRTCFPRRAGRSPITMYDLDPEVTWILFHHSHMSIQTLRRVLTSHYMKSIKDRRSCCCGQHGKYNAL